MIPSQQKPAYLPCSTGSEESGYCDTHCQVVLLPSGCKILQYSVVRSNSSGVQNSEFQIFLCMDDQLLCVSAAQGR